ncbi:hypothetical protein GCM10010922_21530 [Microbacterium sorbitolivorans]|uniref:Uncharacterized protein n=1 Tax=Microbacterium sorbitolivorans TaxID=1867410 RepID=A0A367Y861_9MICO|nr:CueP family metal-binding protein [Microbacterium sorbitolivorans]RCK61809.1 hypothetical protein DTO57_04115 [Microbacterium sorbitolivorans]GGF45496.1 hypothetical protein GCM10010922_21530 [Microbacterium sorbitolivorans]
MNYNHVTARRAKVLTSVGAMLMAASVLVGCSAKTSPTSPAPEAEAPLTVTIEGADDVAGLDARTIIDSLDSTPIADRPTDFTAQVRPDALVITDDSGETELPMPDDQVYVAIAPYEQQTHDCYFHAPVNCVGEQSDTDFDVTVTDSDTGDEYVDQSIRTFDNGFIGMWLPRGVTAEVVIEKDGRTATGTVSTVNDDDATCITTMQLS